LAESRNGAGGVKDKSKQQVGRGFYHSSSSVRYLASFKRAYLESITPNSHEPDRFTHPGGCETSDDLVQSLPLRVEF
jgi:hypothetical protein